MSEYVPAVLTAAMLAARENVPAVDGYRLRYYGDPILSTPCAPVRDVGELEPHLLHSMLRLMREYRGMGLAANQVGSLQRVALITWTVDPDQGQRPVACLNPRLLEQSETLVAAQEGCLSAPGFTTTIWRPARVHLQYEDLDGRTREVWLAGYEARCAVHEIDHLDGKLIFDGLSRQQRRQAERAVEKAQQRAERAR
jgi:peptide deformylase